ncbi:MAG: hypothetical protein MJZ82_05120 [Paludibacteraceae bacterium]|nr:hypothetical protein [Paludibacteraceae bacterium]
MESLEQLHRNVHLLLERYQQLREENQLLIDDNRRQHNELLEANAEIVRLRHELRDLQTAHNILADQKTETREQARLYLTQIINQVDSAIDALRS